MVKLLDSFQAGDAFVCTLFADTKAEVPETAEGIEELVGDVCAPISAGTLIITSAFETAFVRSDGLIQWKGDPAPTPPPTPVTVTLNATNGRLIAQYVDTTTGEITNKTVTESTDTIQVLSGTTITVFSGVSAGGGTITTTAENVEVGTNGDAAHIYLVLIDGETTINYQPWMPGL